MRTLLASSLSDLRLAPEFDRQIFGYWFGPGEDVPQVPVGSPTGAVLPTLDKKVGDAELDCLNLVP